MGLIVTVTAIALTTIVALVTLLPLARYRHWIVRLGEFPRLQVLTLAVIAAVAGFWVPDTALRWTLIAVNAACALWQIAWIARYTPLWRREVVDAGDAPDSDRLRLMVANVLTSNRDAERLLALVDERAPDLLLAVETDAWWEARLERLTDRYPHVIRCPQDNLYGMHIYSRLPLEEFRVQYLVEPTVPSMHGWVRLPAGRTVWFHAIHPAPPSPTENATSAERDAELTLVGRSVTGHDQPVVVAGDLNDVAWSGITRLFRRISGLLDPRVGRGFYHTFHAHWRLLRWPLDHVFHSDHFTLGRIERLGDIGSDHFPVYIELVLQPSRRDDQEPPDLEPGDREAAREQLRFTDTSVEGVHSPDTPAR